MLEVNGPWMEKSKESVMPLEGSMVVQIGGRLGS